MNSIPFIDRISAADPRGIYPLVIEGALGCHYNAILGCVIVDILHAMEELKLVIVAALACAVEEDEHGVGFCIVIVFGENKTVGKRGIAVFVGKLFGGFDIVCVRGKGKHKTG